MEPLEAVRSVAAPEGWSADAVDPPVYDGDDALRCMESCRRNVCGTYGRSWACPPGWSERMDSLTERFGSAILLEKTFENPPDDADAMGRATGELHRVVRMSVSGMRSAGIECVGFADGACDYCGTCSYPEPCRFPDQLVPSISATGTDMGRYLAGMGRSMTFEKDRVTFYGIILYRKGVTERGHPSDAASQTALRRHNLPSATSTSNPPDPTFGLEGIQDACDSRTANPDRFRDACDGYLVICLYQPHDNVLISIHRRWMRQAYRQRHCIGTILKIQ